MPWHFDFDTHRGVLAATLHGRIGPEDAQLCTIEAITLLRRNGSDKLLSDLTDVAQMDLSTTWLFELPSQYRSWGLDRPLRHAIVMPADAPVRDVVQFYETVARNRGHAVRVFSGRGEALAWLLQSSG